MSIERGEVQVKKRLGSLLLGICLMAAVLSVIPVEAQAATGWIKSGSYWYYYNASGVKLTGWQTLPSRAGTDRFYLDPDTNPSGQMVMGWQKIPRVGGKWYYFEPADEYGAMLTGWQYISGDWYHFDKNAATRGQMLTGWQNLLDGASNYWFYFIPGPTNDNGRMAVGDIPMTQIPVRPTGVPATSVGSDYRFGNRGGPNEGRYMPCSSDGMSSRTIAMRTTSTSNTETIPIETARGRWNSAGVSASITMNVTAASLVQVNRVSQAGTVNANLLGTYERLPGNSYFTITLYDVTIVAYVAVFNPLVSYDLTRAMVLEDTLTHELGHALRLADKPTIVGPKSSIMDYIDPPLVVSPTVFDQENVRRCYT
jgi:hypothetical protein